MTASSPRPAAPDTTGGELREEIARTLFETDRQAIDGGAAPWDDEMYGDALLGLRTAYRTAADAVIAGPLRDLLAERDTLAAQVQAVEELAEMWDLIPIGHMETRRFARMAADRIRRALGTPTTGGGE